MVYHRFKYNKKNLTESDFVRGWGQDTDHLLKVLRKRKELGIDDDDNSRQDLYDKRSGYYIDATEIVTRIHPFHANSLLDTESGKIYSIDTVSIQHYFGKYMVLALRPIGSRSHKHINYLNYTCNEPDIVEDCIENLVRYKMIEKVYDPIEDEY
jgi:hypothetical protein